MRQRLVEAKHTLVLLSSRLVVDDVAQLILNTVGHHIQFLPATLAALSLGLNLLLVRDDGRNLLPAFVVVDLYTLQILSLFD